MKTVIFKIPVGDIPPFKKKWWEFWRKKGDSTEEALAGMISNYSGEINFKIFDRKCKIKKIYSLGIENTFPYKKDYWLPNK